LGFTLLHLRVESKLFGITWLAILLGFQKAILAGLVPFLVGDALKIGAAALALPAAWKLVK
jgi:biotin transport system substrate-specific component